jgi:biopolymer transport protein ExbB
MVELFIKGGPFMWPLLFALIVGIAMAFVKFWALTKASINTRKFLAKIKGALSTGGIGAATEVCVNTRGPVASIFHAGLLRAGRGVEYVEKAIESAATIEMAFLERGMVWLATVANIAPMLGFLGTVSGMIKAFQSIALAGDIEPSLVASGISEALITTAAGLAIAIPIQALHNFFVSRIDRLIIEMEESSSDLVDTLTEIEQQAGAPAAARS